jgi:myosin heavy subunit
LKDIKLFTYTNQGDTYTLRHVDDREEFQSLRRAMDTLGIEAGDQLSLLAAMAGLLHLGEIRFTERVGDDEGGCDVSPDSAIQRHLDAAARLCGLPKEDLVKQIIVP